MKAFWKRKPKVTVRHIHCHRGGEGCSQMRGRSPDRADIQTMGKLSVSKSTLLGDLALAFSTCFFQDRHPPRCRDIGSGKTTSPLCEDPDDHGT